jgi:hypothetical protein
MTSTCSLTEEGQTVERGFPGPGQSEAETRDIGSPVAIVHSLHLGLCSMDYIL